jgi:hypothetical protein
LEEYLPKRNVFPKGEYLPECTLVVKRDKSINVWPAAVALLEEELAKFEG